MSLRSRTLRARLLRLSRRAMRLTIRRSRDETAAVASARARFSQLIWRRARPLRLAQAKASTLHLHENHFLIRPDVRVSVQMHLAARALRPAVVLWPRPTRQRWPDIPLVGPSGKLRKGHHLLESLPHRVRMMPPLLESPAQAASFARRLITRVLTSWPARTLARTGIAQPGGLAAREVAIPLPAVRPAGARSGLAANRPEHRRLSRRESPFLPRLIPYRLSDQGMREARSSGHRPPAFQPAARLHRRQAITAGPLPGNLLTWREVAPVTLHFANPRAVASPTTHIEHIPAAAAAPAVTRPAQPAAQSARAVAAPVLDRAATDRLADEVIRRIERRVRIERERRGI